MTAESLMHMCYRFVILYFSLYFFPFPLTVFSGLGRLPLPLNWIGRTAAFLNGLYEQGFNALAVWIGEAVLGLGSGAVIIQPTGSGDTTAAYIRTLLILTLALVGTVIWSVTGRERGVSPRVSNAFGVYLRYALAAVLLTYGFAKVPPLQFQAPGPELLVRTYGDSSPMGLLWTFMGYSAAYTMFAGVAELLPAGLLLFRRTSTLGALIGSATMTNVVALNFCYDVPVKLFSVHLLFALLTLVAFDAHRLLDFFVLNRPVAPADPQPAPGRAKSGLKTAFVIVLLVGSVAGAFQGWYAFGPGAPAAPLAGVYEVEAFSLNGEPRPPLWTDATRWRGLLIAKRGTFVVVQSMGGKNERFALEHDKEKGTCVLRVIGGRDSFTLSCTSTDGEHIKLEGPFRDGTIAAELKKLDAGTFPLNARPFNWVQELPYNR